MIERPATSERDAQWLRIQVQRRSVRGSKGLYRNGEVLERPPMDRAMTESDVVNSRSSFSSSLVTWREIRTFENSAMWRLTKSRR